jgi:hypothetical protein
MDLLTIGGAGAHSEFAELRKRAAWILEHKAKPALAADGYYDPLVFVFQGQRFLNGVSLPMQSHRPLRDEVREAVEVSEGTSCILARVVSHPRRGEALLVALVHPEGEVALCAPFSREEAVTFGPTELLEGEALAGPWGQLLWGRDAIH